MDTPFLDFPEVKIPTMPVPRLVVPNGGIGEGGPVYAVNPASPRETAVRSPGDIWVWNMATGTFKRYSDNTKIPTIGGGATERIQVAGYSVPTLRRAMEGGITVNQGDLLWHQNPDGQCNVIQYVSAGGISCPETWELQHNPTQGQDAQDDFGNTWRTGPPYDPDFGAYLEPDTTNMAARNWNASGASVKTGQTKASLIEGYEAVEFQRTGTAAAWVSVNNGINHVAGESVCISCVVEWYPDEVDETSAIQLRARAGNQTQNRMIINVRPVTGEVYYGAPGAANNQGYHVRFLGNNALAVWHWQEQTDYTGNDGLYVYLPSKLSGAPTEPRLWIHNINAVAKCQWPFQPIPEATTRPGDTRAIISSDYTSDWTDKGMDTEGQMLLLSMSWLDPSQDRHTMFTWRADNNNTGYVCRRTGNRTYLEHNWGTSSTANILNVMAADQERADLQWNGKWRSGPGTTLEACLPGDAMASGSGNYVTPYGRVRDGMFYGGGNVTCPMAIRALAYWNDRDTFDFDSLFGPGTHNNLPLI